MNHSSTLELTYRYLLTLSVLALVPNIVVGQITGTVHDAEGEILPFATIYVKGGTEGAMANEQGKFTLSPEPGNIHLVCESLGYHSVDTILDYSKDEISLAFTLKKRRVELNEVSISSGENPAHPIIRSAQEARERHRIEGLPLRCELYQKGSIVLDSLPKELFGMPIMESDSAMEKLVDSLKQIYLSETESTLFLLEEKNYEHIKSSRVSGGNFLSINRSELVSSNLYEEQLNLPSGVVANPIGPNAFLRYKYKLTSTYVDDHGKLIHQIKCIPKNPQGKVLSGDLYIVNGTWHLSAVDLKIGPGASFAGLDSVYIRQEYFLTDLDGSETWILMKSNFELVYKIFGVVASGGFYGLYSDYEVISALPDTVPKNQVLSFSADALKNDSAYWEQSRPISLSEDEKEDYIEKDSIRRVVTSPEYIDSIDRIHNEFTPEKLFYGYTYRNRNKGRRFSISTPFNSLNVNPVQGVHASVGVEYSDSIQAQKLNLNFGFHDLVFRPEYRGVILLDRLKESKLRYGIGRRLVSLNPLAAPNKDQNTSMAYLFHENPLILTDEWYAELGYAQYLIPSTSLDVELSIGRHGFPINVHERSLFNKEARFHPNRLELSEYLKEGKIDEGVLNGTRRYFRYSIEFSHSFGMEYTRYPNGIYRHPPKGPTLTLRLNAGLPILGGETSFHRLRMEISHTLTKGLLGKTFINGYGAIMLNRNKISVRDLVFAPDNGSYFLSAKKTKTSFLAMPPFVYLSDQAQAGLIGEHDFEGSIFKSLPLLKKTKLSLVLRAGTAWQSAEELYHEYSVGLDDLGFGPVRAWRFDFTAGFMGDKFLGFNYLLGSKINLNEILRQQSISF